MKLKYGVITQVHDSQILESLIDEKDSGQDMFLDSAYQSEGNVVILADKKISPQIIERAYRNRPLTEEQEKNNKIKSKTRARVEHVFAFMEMSMNGMYLYQIALYPTFYE